MLAVLQREKSKMLTILISLYCPNYHRPDRLIHIVECHGKELSIIVASFQTTQTIFNEIRPQITFRVFRLCSCIHLTEINNFGLKAVLVSCSELQEPLLPVLKLRTIFTCLYLSEISTWSHEIIKLSLERTVLSFVENSYYTQFEFCTGQQSEGVAHKPPQTTEILTKKSGPWTSVFLKEQPTNYASF